MLIPETRQSVSGTKSCGQPQWMDEKVESIEHTGRHYIGSKDSLNATAL